MRDKGALLVHYVSGELFIIIGDTEYYTRLYNTMRGSSLLIDHHYLYHHFVSL